MTRDRYNELSAIILDAAIAVHKLMGPGQLESVYQHCLLHELGLRSIMVEKAVVVPLVYKGETLNKDYVIDLLVEGEIILEIKSVEGSPSGARSSNHQLP